MITAIKGRLGDRKNATIVLEDRQLKIATKTGFFGGKTENTIISLDEVTSIEHGTGVKPFPDALMIKIEYPEGELSFFSINKEPLQKIADESEEYIEKRARLLVEMEEEFVLDREAHVALLFLNLELLDALMELLIRLQGSIEWETVETQLVQVNRVNQDRDNLTHMRPPHLNLDLLAQGVEERSVDSIKSEVYDLVSVLHQGSVEKAKHGELWFDTQFHMFFFEALMTLWSCELERITGEVLSEDSEKIDRRFLELKRLVSQETGDIEMSGIDLGATLYDSRILLYEWVEALQNVGFEPGDELEKRLAA